MPGRRGSAPQEASPCGPWSPVDLGWTRTHAHAQQPLPAGTAPPSPGARAQIGVGLLEVTGREAHAGSAYAEGASAIEAMARKITAIHALTDPAREVYLNVGTVRGGWRRSVVAGRAEATLDVLRDMGKRQQFRI